MWADHADLISKAYAGSGALKTDFTRTNKRTKLGVLEDGYKSVMRYVRNNHFDGTRQDGFDLVTGAWTPRKNPITTISLLADTRPLVIRSVSCLCLGKYPSAHQHQGSIHYVFFTVHDLRWSYIA